FYIMVNKVSHGLFARFAATQKLQSTQWTKGAPVGFGEFVTNDDWPVFNVTAADSQNFAQWFGGDLPTLAQWSKAAGAYYSLDSDDVIDGPWKKDDVAVNREQEGPMQVGTAKK